MQVFLVGGAVRDALLGLPIKDRDFVVVGATAQEMMAAGYRQVGRDFPVFLHPQTGEEYALARTERKTGRGYTGFSVDFSPSVSLEEDLRRRDLTLNAMAQAPDGTIIDPYGGQADIAARRLRHVSDAFVEDPLRVLRLMRFWARFAHLGFTIAEETLAFCRTISLSGELQSLTVERVWNECSRALSSQSPAQFFAGLHAVGALSVMIGDTPVALEKMQAALVLATSRTELPEARFALWLEGQSDAIAWVKTHLPLPTRYQKWLEWVERFAEVARTWSQQSAEARYLCLKALDGLKQDETLQRFAQAIGADVASLLNDAHAIRRITPQQLMAEGFQGAALGEALRQRQIECL